MKKKADAFFIIVSQNYLLEEDFSLLDEALEDLFSLEASTFLLDPQFFVAFLLLLLALFLPNIVFTSYYSGYPVPLW